MGLQLLLVYGQNNKAPKKSALEALWVFIGLKPVVDAYRVASGQEMDAHHTMDPLTELTCSKGIEMFCEAIPGTVLQMYALLDTMIGGNKVSQVALGSIGSSILTTGFTAAVISYDFDTDPTKRKETPHFYGFIPDNANARSIVFILLTLCSASLLASRSLVPSRSTF